MRQKALPFISAVILTIAYSIIRIALTIKMFDNFSLIEIAFSIVVLCAEVFVLLHTIGYAIHLIHSTGNDSRTLSQTLPLPFPPPSVAILVAARHEPREILESTFRAISNLRYPSKNVYFLDDSSDKSFKQDAEEICAKFDLNLFRREKRHGAKAGIVNDCLKTLSEKYIVIFDADQNPMPSFLSALIPLIESNDKLAFIQTPQFYTNTKSGPVARGAAFQQAVFYEYICEAKGSNGAMFCCGTNVVFRRAALQSVGGLDETTVTEDIATSLKLHADGWQSMYYPHVGTFGMGPEMLSAYFKQQSRWSRGNFGLLRRVLWNFITHPLRLTAVQKFEYFLASTYYFIGVVFLILMSAPILYLFFDIPSYFIHTDIYVSVFLPYFVLSIGIFYFTLHTRSYRPLDLFLGQILTYITFPIYMASAFLGILGIQGSFGITMKGKGKAIPYLSLWPQVAAFFLCFIAFVWGLNRYWYERDLSILVNCFWTLYHFAIMGAIFYFNNDPVVPGDKS